MLILTRRVGETLNIGDAIQLTVLGIKGKQVRIGINAPKHIPVHREEVLERIKRKKQLSSSVIENQSRGLTGEAIAASVSPPAN